MSNLETAPSEYQLTTGGGAVPDGQCPGVDVEIITAREVPLGGPRALTVRRTLPQRKRSLIGAWCFVDHYGPADVATTGGMDVAPHPHTGLQTVSWLFSGEIQHIDSGGNRGIVYPAEINLMTSGYGICHSETSTPETTTLHGVQLWLALPETARSTAPRQFEHYAPNALSLDDASSSTAHVFIGNLLGQRSPIETFTPLVGAQFRLAPGDSVTFAVDPAFEHGVLADVDGLALEGVSLPRGAIGYTGVGATELNLTNTTDAEALAVLIGGEPFTEDILMWWNFVGRDHAEIVEARNQWQERSERFGVVEGYVGRGGPDANADGMAWLPAPELPNAEIRPRVNPAPVARGEDED
ncbi:pirin family protein [Corynebacterium sanguinis]|uniref:pirin family protein n=1 Tax=Corynebacterium sanguinis TaxID=2594913 RepID=UPI00223B520C|nr:pirin family protein [Corynebacterium sanguinis]MCT1414671.1 pirin family protein [Corynebacterium sanguinis]